MMGNLAVNAADALFMIIGQLFCLVRSWVDLRK